MSLSKQQLISAPIAGNAFWGNSLSRSLNLPFSPSHPLSLSLALSPFVSLFIALFAIVFLSSYLLDWLSICGWPLVFTLAAADSNELFYTRPCVLAQLHVHVRVQSEHPLSAHRLFAYHSLRQQCSICSHSNNYSNFNCERNWKTSNTSCKYYEKIFEKLVCLLLQLQKWAENRFCYRWCLQKRLRATPFSVVMAVTTRSARL